MTEWNKERVTAGLVDAVLAVYDAWWQYAAPKMERDLGKRREQHANDGLTSALSYIVLGEIHDERWGESFERLHQELIEKRRRGDLGRPIPMLLWCPGCHARHVDAGEFATEPHHTHACQACGMVWRPALVATVGVQFLPGTPPWKGKEKEGGGHK